VADNFCAFGQYISQKINERKEIRKTLSISGQSINREIAKKVSVLDDYRNRAKNLGFYGGAAMLELKSDLMTDEPHDGAAAASVPDQFVPGFLRKNRD
jgi:hypothetical protein